MISRVLLFTARCCFVLFLLVTASFCLFAYVPFTYHEIILSADLVPGVAAFMKFHAWIYWLALVIVAPTLVSDFRRPRTRWIAVGFFVVWGALGIVLLVRPLLPHIPNSITSLFWGVLFLLPLPWLALIDWMGYGRNLSWAPVASNEDQRVFRAAWQSAVFVALVYAAIAYFGQHSRATAGTAIELIWSLVCHLLVFMLLFAAVVLLRLLTRRFSQSGLAEFFLFAVVGCVIVTMFLRFAVFPLLSFHGLAANIFALVVGLSFGSAFAALCARLAAGDSGTDTGLALLLRPLLWRRLLPGVMGFAVFAFIALLAWLLAARSGTLDWNFLKQKLSAFFIWVVTFANFYDLAPRREGAPISMLRRVAWAAVVIAPIGAYGVLRQAQLHTSVQIAGSPVRVDQVLDQYAGYNASFKILFDGFVPFHSAPPFFRFLKANTNLDASAESASVDVKLVDQFVPNRGPKPNIFIFVIDSLRRDYLSVYNPAVTFSPNFEAFARESVTFTNAFTRYGGTGLSEPSIWSGAMLLHKQYPEPFYPMNTLEKLIEADGYRSYVTWDSILKKTVRPSDSIQPLDTDIPGRPYDFCKLMQDMEDELSFGKPAEGGIFAYSQAQNIHTWVVNREGASVPPGESYPGFYEPVAARIHYMDQCWGKFDKFMKQSGLYENSIVVLTSDHGEMLGEEGRWGHGYAMIENIARIPLIIHVPQSLRSRMYVNPDSPAFLIDISPTLYYLLGHRPIVRNDLFGKPLFTETREEAAEYERPSYLLVSSYTPVYAILTGDAHSLFVASAADEREYLFELSLKSAAVELSVTPEASARYEDLIQSDVKQIARFYSFTASP